MGLDMYLSRKTYVQRWDHQPEDEKFRVTVKRGGKVFKAIDSDSVSYIEEKAMYWRKSNHIHQWFVDNVQDGEDDCKEYYVPIEKLKELKNLCVKVLSDVSKASETLPTQPGFFFGGTEYDEWYISDTKSTLKALTKLLKRSEKDEETGSYYYSSSW